MGELERFNVGGLTGSGSVPRSRVVERRTNKKAAEILADLQLESLALGGENHLNQFRVRIVEHVTCQALDAQLDISSRARIAAEIEPGAIGDLAYLSQKGTLGLGAVIDATVWRITQ